MLEYNETHYINIKELSCLAVGKICNLYKKINKIDDRWDKTDIKEIEEKWI